MPAVHLSIRSVIEGRHGVGAQDDICVTARQHTGRAARIASQQSGALCKIFVATGLELGFLGPHPHLDCGTQAELGASEEKTSRIGPWLSQLPPNNIRHVLSVS